MPKATRTGRVRASRSRLPLHADPVEDKGPEGSGDAPPVKGLHRIVEGRRHPAHGLGADLFPQKGKEGDADLSCGETQKKTGEDQMVDLPDPSARRRQQCHEG